MLGLVMPAWQALLDFWFGRLNAGLADDSHRRQWFTPDAQFDARCRQHFQHLLDKDVEPSLNAWLTTPQGRLAFIVLTDQLPRNIFRGTARAFAWDHLALQAAKQGLREEDDRKLPWDYRAFFYLPFEHSESLSDQHLAVGLFTFLRDESPKDIRQITGNYLRFAQQHRDIIARFGRFPHRNAVLGRMSSDDELAFIADTDGFGQNH
jgi:uncharacterized protein (DUF924 family)